MGDLDGRVAVITGGGRGLGREYALAFAREGARVVVNDLGGGTHGEAPGSAGPAGPAVSPADEVVAEIKAAGGEAVADHGDITDWDAGERLVRTALDIFGELHVVVNNAGIVRDRMLVNMTEDEWDDVVEVHLKGHFVVTRWAARYWRERAEAGDPVRASLINTTSASGLFGNRGQTNYGSAKAGIALFTVTCSKELAPYGVRSNAISPAARTRMLLATPRFAERAAPPESGFDEWDPTNIAPVATWLATEDCPVTGQVYLVHGGSVRPCRPFVLEDGITKDGAWTVAELRAHADELTVAKPR